MIPPHLQSQIDQQVKDTQEQALHSAGNPPEKVFCRKDLAWPKAPLTTQEEAESGNPAKTDMTTTPPA